MSEGNDVRGRCQREMRCGEVSGGNEVLGRCQREMRCGEVSERNEVRGRCAGEVSEGNEVSGRCLCLSSQLISVLYKNIKGYKERLLNITKKQRSV